MNATTTTKPTVIGIYGLSGSGKSSLLLRFEETLLGSTDYSFFEGSAELDSVTEGGLDAFKSMPDDRKAEYRKRAVEKMKNTCCEKNTTGIVAGNYSIWSKNKGFREEEVVWTESDANLFTHIVYLERDSKSLALQIQGDKTRNDRPVLSKNGLRDWQYRETTGLRKFCRDHHILFSSVSSALLREEMEVTVAGRIQDFQRHNEEYNVREAEKRLKEIVTLAGGSCKIETMLVLDADKTLAPQDAGNVFWGEEMREEIKELFSGPMSWVYIGFRQYTLFVGEQYNETEYGQECEKAAKQVTMHKELLDPLDYVKGQEHVGAVVVTCGLRGVWEKVLEANGLANSVQIIGGGRMWSQLKSSGLSLPGFRICIMLTSMLLATVRWTCRCSSRLTKPSWL
jgi:hypothetical protein